MARFLTLAISVSEASAGLRGQPLVSALSKVRSFFTTQEGTHESWTEDLWTNADPWSNDADNVTKPDPDYCPKPEEYDWFPCHTHWDDEEQVAGLQAAAQWAEVRISNRGMQELPGSVLQTEKWCQLRVPALSAWSGHTANGTAIYHNHVNSILPKA
jgi:hypothetical protein